MRPLFDANLFGCNALAQHFGVGLCIQCRQNCLRCVQFGERFAKLPFPQGANIRQTHAKCGQYPRKGMDKNPLHSQRIGDQTRMLPARTAKTLQRVLGDIVAALHRNFLDRIRHVFHSNAQKTFR